MYRLPCVVFGNGPTRSIPTYKEILIQLANCMCRLILVGYAMQNVHKILNFIKFYYLIPHLGLDWNGMKSC